MLIRDYVAAAANAFGVGTMEIYRPDRSRRSAHPRFAAMYMAYKAGFSFSQIGIGIRRDHSTVIHGERRAIELARGDEDYALRLSAAMQEVGLA